VVSTTTIQEVHKDFVDVFDKKNEDILPEYYLYDCAIDPQEGAQPLPWTHL